MPNAYSLLLYIQTQSKAESLTSSLAIIQVGYLTRQMVTIAQ